ncbi:MAG: hypothetical protein A2X94_12875 [Bdellovibrionales bacterium GWB1_55_8]|nr:MAG: hypothetical protein A2X94_12875 [Bdellovibrionales bacterium GWB1_55_8]
MKNESGFTLLETLIAMAIMLVAFTAILSVQSASINASDRARQMNVVAMLAKNRMIEYEHEFEGKTFDEFKKKDAGQFKSPYEDYRWETEIKEIEFPNLNLSSGGNKEESGGGDDSASSDTASQMTKLVTNHLSKAVREATVTVFWKKGTGEQHFSVSTYWVDLNRDFQLSL